MDTSELVRTFGRDSDTSSTQLHNLLKSSIAKQSHNELRELASAVIANHMVPIDIAREFLTDIPAPVFSMRSKTRRTILYEALSTREAAIATILNRTPERVMTSVDSNGMTPYHYACRHGSVASISTTGNRTPHDAREKLSRSGRTPLMEGVILLRGSSVIEAIMPFTSHTNLWHARDKYGLCVLHIAMCATDDYAVNQILDRLESVADIYDNLTGRSIISTAMDTDMPLVHVVNLIGSMMQRCPNILGDLMNASSSKTTDPVDIFQHTMHSSHVTDALIAAIPESRMHETLTRRRGLCSSTIFHIAADYPIAFIRLFGRGVCCGITPQEMLSTQGSITGTPMHAIADWCYSNLKDVVADLRIHCSLAHIVQAMFVVRPYDQLYAFECLRDNRDFDHFLQLTIACTPAKLWVTTHRLALVRHAVRVGSDSVLQGEFAHDLNNATVCGAHELLHIAAHSFASGNRQLYTILLKILSLVHPRNVSTATERSLLVACNMHTFCFNNSVDELNDRNRALDAMVEICRRVRAIRSWRRLRHYVQLRWLVNWWFEQTNRIDYAPPEGAVFVANRDRAMSLIQR